MVHAKVNDKQTHCGSHLIVKGQLNCMYGEFS
jgi:hypothetical protein